MDITNMSWTDIKNLVCSNQDFKLDIAGQIYKPMDITNMSWTDIKNLVCSNQDFKLDIAGQMEKRGESFVKALGNAMIWADKVNLAKLCEAFMPYIKEYAPDKYKGGDNQ